MDIHVCITPVDNPYTRRVLWGRPLGDYAAQETRSNQVHAVPKEGFVAEITSDMPLITYAFLRHLAEQMQSMGIPAMRLGKGALYAVGHQTDTPKYRCGSEEALSVEDEATFARCAEALHRRLVQNALRLGAILPAPASVYADCGVRFAKGAYVHPFVVLQGHTVLAEDCVILPFSHLVDATVGKGAVIGGYHTQSVFESYAQVHPYCATRQCGIAAHTQLMPFALASSSLLGEEVFLGGGCYLDNATVQNRARLPYGTVCRNKEIEVC